MKNTGLPYENLTMQIFNTFLNQNEVENIKLKHNITLNGKSTTHQIDVYWEFKLANDITYFTIIQAKDEKSKISKGQMLTFSGVLSDLPNQPRGIFVTRTGYQKGAIEVANSYGIQLYTLGEPQESYWDDSIKTLGFQLIAYFPSMKDFKPVVDKEWMKKEYELRGIPLNKDITYSSSAADLYLLGSDRKRLCSIADLINDYHTFFPQEVFEKEVRETFKEEIFLEMKSAELEYIKLKGIVVTLIKKYTKKIS